MKTFDEIWEFTDTIPGSFTRLSGEKLFEYATQCEGTIVEVGVDQGRSASVLLEAARGRCDVVLIDAWESILIDNMEKVKRMALRFDSDHAATIRCASAPAAEKFANETFDLLHIDAHHHDDISDGGPELDCALWLPKVKRGGIACLHDVGGTFPDVDRAVKNHLSTWESLGVWDGLGIWRKK